MAVITVDYGTDIKKYNLSNDRAMALEKLLTQKEGLLPVKSSSGKALPYNLYQYGGRSHIHKSHK